MNKKKSSSSKSWDKNKSRGRKIANVLLKILDDNKAILFSELSGKERYSLSRIKNDLKSGCTGKWRKPTKAWERFGQFNHLIFQLPCNHGRWKFKYATKTVVKFRDTLWDVLADVFGIKDDYRIGLYMRAHPQCKDDREAEFHFHVVQSKHVFHWDDRQFMEFFKTLTEDDKPFYALNLLHQPLMLEPDKLAELLEVKWRDAIFALTGRKVSKQHGPLVEVISKERQIKKDRLKIAKYSANPALHTFRDIYIKSDPERKGFVLLTYKEKDSDGYRKIVSMPVVKFVRRYLLLMNKNLKIYNGPKI